MLISISALAGLSPDQVSGAVTIDGDKAKQLFDEGALFVDPRGDADWEAGRIPGALHLDVKKDLTKDSLGAEAKEDESVVFYCNGIKCMRSSEACDKAVAWGYSKVYYYRNGLPDWKQRGYPVE